MELRGACDGRLSAIDGAMDERKRRALVCSSLEMQSTDTDARPACAELHASHVPAAPFRINLLRPPWQRVLRLCAKPPASLTAMPVSWCEDHV